MIDGEIYVVQSATDCVFAYCERGMCSTSFYIGVGRYGGRVYISSSSRIYGMCGTMETRLANESERERFFTQISRAGYYYSVQNKAVFKDGRRIKI